MGERPADEWRLPALDRLRDDFVHAVEREQAAPSHESRRPPGFRRLLAVAVLAAGVAVALPAAWRRR